MASLELWIEDHSATEIICPAGAVYVNISVGLAEVVLLAIVCPQKMVVVWHWASRGKQISPSTTGSQSIQKGRRDEAA